MPEYISRPAESYRRVEPIFDASGTLKRHALSRTDGGQRSEPGEKASETE